MSTKRFARVMAIYLLGLLIVTLAAGYPLSWWLSVVAIMPFYLLIRHFVLRKWLIRPQTELERLTNLICLERGAWRLMERIWLGRTVLLREDIRNTNEPEGLQVYVRAGTVGNIVALNRDEHAPFQVQFPGFAHKVAVRLEKLDMNPTGNRRKPTARWSA